MPFYTYIATNKWHTVLYTGVTNDIYRRMSEHTSGTIPGFTQRYRVNKLVFVEEFEYIYDALEAEKRIKGWTRKKKVHLIESMNPHWNELAPSGDPSPSAQNDRDQRDV